MPPANGELLSTKIADLRLRIEGTRLEPLLKQLHLDLEGARREREDAR